MHAMTSQNIYILVQCATCSVQPRSQALSSPGGREMKEPGNEVVLSAAFNAESAWRVTVVPLIPEAPACVARVTCESRRYRSRHPPW